MPLTRRGCHRQAGLPAREEGNPEPSDCDVLQMLAVANIGIPVVGSREAHEARDSPLRMPDGLWGLAIRFWGREGTSPVTVRRSPVAVPAAATACPALPARRMADRACATPPRAGCRA